MDLSWDCYFDKDQGRKTVEDLCQMAVEDFETKTIGCSGLKVVGMRTVGLRMKTVGLGMRTVSLGMRTVGLGMKTVGLGMRTVCLGMKTVGFGMKAAVLDP